MRQLLISLFLLGLAQVAWSHPGGGHDHQYEEPAPVTSVQAQSLAKDVVAQKVTAGKLPPSWLEIEAEKAYKKTFNRETEWVVEFKDPNATDEARSTVYVFLGQTGKVLGINYTGK